MPRQRGGAPSRSSVPTAPKRPSVAPPTPAPQQHRQASTAAHPPAQAAPQAQQSSGGSGLFGQMASTAAGVAVGSSIGHAIGGFFGGGSSSSTEAAAPQQYNATAADANQSYQASQQSYGNQACEVDAKNFTTCMSENKGNMQICSWYLEQLKACQQAASQY